MKIQRLWALVMSISILFTACIGHASPNYQYLFDNAAGKVFKITTDDNWEFMFFQGQGRMACTGYKGLNSHVTLPSEVDGYPVMIGNMNLPYGQIERFEIPEYYDEISSDMFGNVSTLKAGCTIVIYNRQANIELPAGLCGNMRFVFSGYSGSTTQEYARQNGLPFVTLDNKGSSTVTTAPESSVSVTDAPDCQHEYSVHHDKPVSGSGVWADNGDGTHRRTEVKYKQYCSKCGVQGPDHVVYDDVLSQAHTLDKNGNCVCGYISPVTNTEEVFTVYYKFITVENSKYTEGKGQEATGTIIADASKVDQIAIWASGSNGTWVQPNVSSRFYFEVVGDSSVFAINKNAYSGAINDAGSVTVNIWDGEANAVIASVEVVVVQIALTDGKNVYNADNPLSISAQTNNTNTIIKGLKITGISDTSNAKLWLSNERIVSVYSDAKGVSLTSTGRSGVAQLYATLYDNNGVIIAGQEKVLVCNIVASARRAYAIASTPFSNGDLITLEDGTQIGRQVATAQYANDEIFPDLNYATTNVIEASSAADVRTALQSIPSSDTDVTMLYIFAHGDTQGNMYFGGTSSANQISATEFATLVNDISGTVVVIMESCFGGISINEIERIDDDGSVFAISAAEEDKSSRGNVFSLAVLHALKSAALSGEQITLEQLQKIGNIAIIDAYAKWIEEEKKVISSSSNLELILDYLDWLLSRDSRYDEISREVENRKDYSPVIHAPDSDFDVLNGTNVEYLEEQDLFTTEN